MADDNDKLLISELDPALTLDNTSETVVNKKVSGAWVTLKMTIATLAAHILETFSSSSLTTTNKTVIGAINELNTAGSSSLAGLTDTTINNPSNGQVLKYNGTTGKWENQAGGAAYTELTGTLTAGNTSLTIQDSSITTDSTIEPFTNVYGVNPTNIVVTTGQVVLTFEARQANLGVKVRVS